MDGEFSLLSQTLLRNALERALGRYLTRNVASREILSRLSGKVIAASAPPLIASVYLVATPAGIQLHTEFSGRPDVTLTATPLAFIKLGLGHADMFSGNIAIGGETTVAEQMQRLIRISLPRWQSTAGELATPHVAGQASAWVRALGDWRRATAASLQQDLGEFLREEVRAVPSPSEARDFRSGVEHLRSDCERLDARIGLLRARVARTQDDLEAI